MNEMIRIVPPHRGRQQVQARTVQACGALGSSVRHEPPATAGLAYTGVYPDALRVFDLTVPETPVELSSTQPLDAVLDIVLSGWHAYLAVLNSGLEVFDLSVPAAPVHLSSFDTPGQARGVAVVGDLAYVADGDSGLRVIDISTPATPFEIGSVATPGDAYEVGLAGGFAFVADRNSGVRVIDISVPTAPGEVGFFDPGQMNARGIVVAGDRAYVANYSYGLLVLDISTPSAPTEIGSYDTLGRVVGVFLDDGMIVVADDNAGLALFGGCSDVLFDDGFEALGTLAWAATQP